MRNFHSRHAMNDANRPRTPQPATVSPLLVGLAIWLFFPLGFFLLWRHPTLGKNGKWWAAGLAWACFIMIVGSRAEQVNSHDEPASKVTREQTAESSDDSPAESSTGAGTPTGESFSAKQMDGLYKKVFKLRIGMGPSEVFGIMGPPTKRDVFDPADHTLPGLPVVDARPQDTATWSSSEDPGSAYVMVNFIDGRAFDIVANKKGGKVLSLKEGR